MEDIIPIDLRRQVPAEADIAVIKYRTENGVRARAQILKFKDDQSPTMIHGPRGIVKVNVSAGKIIYLKSLDKVDWHINYVDHRFSWGKRITQFDPNESLSLLRRSGLWPFVLGLLVGIAIIATCWFVVLKPNYKVLEAIHDSAPILAVVVSVFALISSLRHQRFAMGVDILAKLDDAYGSDEMRAVRARAASQLVGKNLERDPDVDRLLDFFEHIGLVQRRGAVDLELVWHAFYSPITFYCDVTTEYRSRARLEDPAHWEDIERLASRMYKYQRRRDCRLTEVSICTQDELTPGQHEFLDEESALDESLSAKPPTLTPEGHARPDTPA
jgi:hypothetical protein